MILRKQDAFISDDERDKLFSISDTLRRITAESRPMYEQGIALQKDGKHDESIAIIKQAGDMFRAEMSAAMADRDEIIKNVNMRYIHSVMNDDAKILSDIAETLEPITVDDYAEYMKPYTELADLRSVSMKVRGVETRSLTTAEQEYLVMGEKSCSAFLKAACRLQEEALMLGRTIDADYFTRDDSPLNIYEKLISSKTAELLAAIGKTPSRHYTTKAKALAASDEISNLEALMRERTLAFPTLTGFQNSLMPVEKGNAYLFPLGTANGLRFTDGKIYFEGSLKALSSAELQDQKTKESIANIDLPLLVAFYSILLNEYSRKQSLTGEAPKNATLTLYMNDLAKYLGYSKAPNKTHIGEIVAKAQSFDNIIGVIKGERGTSYYKLLNFRYYNSETNTISLDFPYLERLINAISDNATQRDKKGKVKLQSNGRPYLKPTHTYLIKPEISKEKNQIAVENVFIIVSLIERAGNTRPHISAQKLMEDNPLFFEAYSKCTSREKATKLKRIFSKTWELLRTMTYLNEVYKDIQLPDENNPANIPTPATMASIVFEFPHKGKHGRKPEAETEAERQKK